MSTTNNRTKTSSPYELNLALSNLESDLVHFITSLIEQNAELAEKLQHIDSLTKLAEQKVIEAGIEAAAIREAAEREASTGTSVAVTGVVERTQTVAHVVIPMNVENTEAESKRIMDETGQRSDDNVVEFRNEDKEASIQKETRELPTSSEQTAKNFNDVSLELCAILDRDEIIEATNREGLGVVPAYPEYGATPRASDDLCSSETAQDDPLSDKNGLYEKESAEFYADFVDIVLPPTISLGVLLKMWRKLNKYPGVRVICVKGSMGRGLWIRFIVGAQTPLINVFEALGELDGLSYDVAEVGKVFSMQK